MIQKIQKAILFLFLLLNIFYCSAQVFPSKNYPQNYFIWPVDAATSLSANFGELRSNHYHMGFDCRTDRIQNKRVFAVADGYIAKVKVEPWGYGRAIYINHPNGLTTLYAHLNDFYPELEKYIKEQQYKLKSWSVYLDIPASLFTVSQGQWIAYSGNTGGSQAPHLHFEIRDTKTDKVLNPSLFGFSIPDNVAPDIFRLAVYDRTISTYEQTPKLYSVKKVNGVYTTSPSLILVNTGKVSFGITATDRYTGSANRNGIYEAILSENGNPVTAFQLDSISYDETRYLNAHIDYKLRSTGGAYIQHLSQLPGYANSIYKRITGDGVITIDDDSIHPISVEVKDANGNASILKFEIKRNPGFKGPVKNEQASPWQSTEFHPGFINLYENKNISFYLPQNYIYDSFKFRYSETTPNDGFPVYQLHNTSVPVHGYFPVMIKASASHPDKMVMHRFANGKDDYARAEPLKNGTETGWFMANFREFGSFQLMIDTIPPAISPVGFKDGMDCSKLTRLVFVVTDNTEEIKNFTATLDGNWLRFSNDKGRVFIYDFDENCAAGEHELKIVAEDLVGNKTEKIYHFTR